MYSLAEDDAADQESEDKFYGNAAQPPCSRCTTEIESDGNEVKERDPLDKGELQCRISRAHQSRANNTDSSGTSTPQAG